VGDENAWIHVDGAFGLWATASPRLASCCQGIARADSWATDAHKWFVPYDSGIVIVRDAKHHRRFKAGRCSYAGEESEHRRDGSTWAPENSRRARAFVLYAMLRELGRSGVQAVLERCCRLAQVFARGAARLEGAQVLNAVVLNQVLVRFSSPAVDDAEAFHQAIAARIQSDGRCWLGTTLWHGRMALRVSICNWQTTEEDISTALRALAAAVQAAKAGFSRADPRPTQAPDPACPPVPDPASDPAKALQGGFVRHATEGIEMP